MNKALTLTELIIAIALAGVIILGVTSFDISSRQMLKSSESKTQVMNEATLIMDRITKDALTGIGDVGNPAITISASFFNITQDVNGNGIRDAVDPVISYEFDNAAHTLTRTVDTNPEETLSNKVVTFTSSLPGDNTANIIITLRKNPDPAVAVDAFENPEVTIQSSVEVPAWSIN